MGIIGPKVHPSITATRTHSINVVRMGKLAQFSTEITVTVLENRLQLATWSRIVLLLQLELMEIPMTNLRLKPSICLTKPYSCKTRTCADDEKR